VPSSTAKRVLVYRFDRQPLEAIVNPADYLRDGFIEFITVGGMLQSAPYSEVKALCFAPEPGRPDLFTRQNLFERRPKIPGLWARFTFRDGDQLEGLLAHNLLDWPVTGYLMTPPGAGNTRQRVFLPRKGVSHAELLGVIGKNSSSSSRKRATAARNSNQLSIFEG
jgi:hypothetical protein